MNEDYFYKNFNVIRKCGTDALRRLLHYELTQQNLTVEQFIHLKQHEVYHLHRWKRCCQCPPGTRAYSRQILTQAQLELLLDKRNHLPGHILQSSSPFCCSQAKAAIQVDDFDITISRALLLNFGSIYRSIQLPVEKIMEYRNSYTHNTQSILSKDDYEAHRKDISTAITDINIFCGLQNTPVKDEVDETYQMPLDRSLCQQYHSKLIEELQLHHTLQETVTQIKEIIIDSRMDFEEVIDRKVKEHFNLMKNKLHGKRKIKKAKRSSRKTGSIKQNLIDQGKYRVSRHENDQTYSETASVHRGLAILNKHNILTLVSRPGVGKTKVCLQIATYCTRLGMNPIIFLEKEVLKKRELIDLSIDTLIIIEDLFGKVNAAFRPEHKDFLDCVQSWIQDKEKSRIFVILTISAKGEKAINILKQHEIFSKDTVLNLDDDCPLTNKDKFEIFCKHAAKKNVRISDRVCQTYCQGVITENDQLEICSCQTKLILDTDPYIGFPECCYLFFMDKSMTKIGSKYFKNPSINLVERIDSFFTKGLEEKNLACMYKYVILVYMATTNTFLKASYQQNDMLIEDEEFKDLFKFFDKDTVIVRAKMINSTIKSLEGEFLEKIEVDGDKMKVLDFQHDTIRIAVLMSYVHIDPQNILQFDNIFFIFDHIHPTVFQLDEERDQRTIPIDFELLKSLLIAHLMKSVEDVHGLNYELYSICNEFTSLSLQNFDENFDDETEFLLSDSDSVEGLNLDCENQSDTSAQYSPEMTKETSSSKRQYQFNRSRSFTKNNSKMMYLIKHLSQAIGKYLKDNVLEKGGKNEILSFVHTAMKMVKPIHVTGLLDGLTDRGMSSTLTADISGELSSLIFSDGSTSVVCGLVRPYSSKHCPKGVVYIDDERLISEYLMNKISSVHFREAFKLGQYLFCVGIEEQNREFLEKTFQQISKITKYNASVSFFIDGFLDHGRHFKQFSVTSINELILTHGSIEILMSCFRLSDLYVNSNDIHPKCLTVAKKDLLRYFGERCQGYFVNLNSWEKYLAFAYSQFDHSLLEYGGEDFSIDTAFDIENLFHQCQLFAKETRDYDFMDKILSKMLDTMKKELAVQFRQPYMDLFLMTFQDETSPLKQRFPATAELF